VPDGSVRNISAVARAILDERGNVSRLIGVNMDVTERKEAEQALEQIRQDQMRFKDEFLSHVSHELRSPLTAIKQFTTILLGGLAGELNKEQREYQEIVLKNIRQLQAMIDDLLEVTRLETGKLTVEAQSVSVPDAVMDTFNTLEGTARAKGVTLSCDLPPNLPSVYADQTRLRQILIILLDNAIKFTPDGGAVTIQARLLEQDPRFLLLEVADTGCGIKPEEMTERIFERLYQISERIQASRKGLGLGLYICKELVTRQGGEIWVESRPQQGSTFSFTLPVFSLDNSSAPLLKNDNWPAEPVALVEESTESSNHLGGCLT
jgi:signal transduction histidine kinase